jgi:hypothetical protein
MTSQDIATYIAAAAGVIGTAYAIVAYHRPKGAPVSSPPKPAKGVKGMPTPAPATPANSWGPFWPIVIAVAAWSAVAFDFVDRHWLSVNAPLESALSSTNARIDPKLSSLQLNDQKQYVVNILLLNGGKLAAIGPVHSGSLNLYGGGDLTPEGAIHVFLALSRESVRTSPLINSEIQPQEADKYFSFFGPPVTDAQISAVDSGSMLVYVVGIVRYRDSDIPPDKFIYTEICHYYFKGVLHECEGGHNRSYIFRLKIKCPLI